MLSSGNCNVCEDVVNEMKKKLLATRKKTNFDKVELDLKLMIDTHNKLGIVNILSQIEEMDGLEKRLKFLECDDQSNNLKIVYLKNWVLKQNDSIEYMNSKLSKIDENRLLKENALFHSIDEKIAGIESEISVLKSESS